MATCLMMSSVREKSLQSRSSVSKRWRLWLSHTDMTFQSQLQTLKRLFSGYTSDTLQLSRLRTVQLCQLDVYLHSLISILREIWRLVSLQRLRLRSLSIISQWSFVWLSSQELSHTTSCSQEILYGLLLRLVVSVLMDVQWLQRTITDSFIHLRTWDQLQSQTLQFFTHQLFRIHSRSMLLRSL